MNYCWRKWDKCLVLGITIKECHLSKKMMDHSHLHLHNKVSHDNNRWPFEGKWMFLYFCYLPFLQFNLGHFFTAKFMKMHHSSFLYVLTGCFIIWLHSCRDWRVGKCNFVTQLAPSSFIWWFEDKVSLRSLDQAASINILTPFRSIEL